jgi:hypothetical protein
MQFTTTLKTITYEEARHDFFLKKKHEAERKLEWWKKRLSKRMALSTMHIDQKCADLGWEINFYDDALKALSKEVKQ